MKCPKCQFENSEGLKFCVECGNKLETICSNCGFGNAPSFKFCGECGQDLTLPSEPTPKDLSFDEKIDKIQRYLPKGLTEKILSQRDKIEGERKQVTVMFCDMKGFTPMVERLGPEKAYSIMDEIYEILIHKVHDFDGTVNEMTGDGIMALFGAPIALEDAPQRALRSALSIHNEIAKFSEQKKGINPIEMRIGVHTGPVVVGTLGNNLRVEFKAVGDTVNLASRMEGLAESGTTYVTRDTFRLTQGLFRFEVLGEKEVKGKGKPVPVHKLLSVKKDVYRPRLGAERMIYSKMVGRDSELNKVELQVMKAVNGEGSIVNIIGEAGIGKSRLMAELKNRDVLKKVVILEGSAISIGSNLSFHPIVDLLRQWARISEDDGQRSAFYKLEAAVSNIHPEEIDEILPFVATLMGMKLTGRYAERVKGIEGEALEKLIFKNVRELLIKASELTPLVIVVEDLHWADTSSINLMESLFPLAETQRIIFLNLFRPNHKETGDKIVETIKEKLPAYYVEIVLQPLDKKKGETLINNMLKMKGLHHPIVDQIISRADGNPFFIEEVVRSLIDVGAVVTKERSFVVTDKINTMDIPHTINDVLMARIDRLEDDTRDLLKIASVIGRNFFYRVLAEVTKMIGDIDNRLSYLKEIQIILERRRLKELEYLFKHALAQEAAYESILQQKRKALHLQVANSMEKVFKDRLHEFYGMLAFHYSKGENHQRAEHYLIKAGEEALRSSASTEALNYYQEGLRLYLQFSEDAKDPDKMVTFETNIAIALYNKSRWAESVHHFDKVCEHWDVATSPNRMFVLIKFLRNAIFIMSGLYSLFKKRKTPSQRDNEIFNIIYREGSALYFCDTTRVLFYGLAGFNRAFKVDLTKSPQAINTFIGLAGLFSVARLFHKLSHKLLVISKSKMDMSNIRNLMAYEMTYTSLNVSWGYWDKIKFLEKTLVDKALDKGEFWTVVNYIYVFSYGKTQKGVFLDTELSIARLIEIGENYDYELATLMAVIVKTMLLLTRGQFCEAKMEAEKGVTLSRKHITITQLSALSRVAEALTFLDDVDGAKQAMLQAKAVADQQKFIPCVYIAQYLVAQFMIDIHILKKSTVSKKEPYPSKLQKKAYQSGKSAIKTLSKYAPFRTKTLRLMGEYYWLIGNQTKALKWWKRAIKKGEKLGARPDLSRTFFEIGKSFLEPGSNHKELNGITAEEYLQKARTMFEEMDLQWDLEQLDRIGGLG